MAGRYTAEILLVLLMGIIVMIPETTGLSKSPPYPFHQTRTLSPKSHRVTPLHLYSSCALVEDQKTGEYLVKKNAKAIVPIASITKIMTAMVLLDAGMDLQESLVIENHDVDTLRYSRSRLPVGTRLTRREALLLALMASENRAANALSRTYPGGRDALVDAMNTKAQSMGLTETYFEDPAGLSGRNVSSAIDLARMVEVAHRYPLIRDFSTRKKDTILSGRQKLTFHNTNQLVRNSRWRIGLSKTGYIDEAGRCLVMQAYVAHRPVLIVLLDAQGDAFRSGDARRIKQWMEGPPPSRKTRRA
jgi:D-alanyl-D-alanine endopeptidase (penicillin-binding protein 7)